MKALAELAKALRALRQDVRSEGERINRLSIRNEAALLSQQWFDNVVPILRGKFGLDDSVLEEFSERFGRLLRISAPNNRRTSYEEVLDFVCDKIRDRLILPIQTSVVEGTTRTELDNILDQVGNAEQSEYLSEAIACAKHHYFRGSVVLGWCAAIDHIHRKIEEVGFEYFNRSSQSMALATAGRFKRFNKQYSINSINEIRTVFDSDVLWIIEGMGLIDTNEHTRLSGCFDMRCHAAHPGNAPTTIYNLMSFYSDIIEIVLNNPRLALSGVDGASVTSIQ